MAHSRTRIPQGYAAIKAEDEVCVYEGRGSRA
jgi:hypothetical protein